MMGMWGWRCGAGDVGLGMWGWRCGAAVGPGFTFGMVGQDEEADAGGAGPGPKDGDALWVAPKVPHVLVEPPQRLDLVQQAVVAFGRLVPSAQETWGAGEAAMGNRTHRYGASAPH